MGSRAEIVVDLDAIRANVAHLIEVCGPVMVVVKADGYGHGMEPVARAARQAGARWIGVATIDEALALRDAGDEGRLLCWLTAPGEDYARAVEAGIDLTAYTVAEVDEIAEAANPDRPARLQLKVDTGLSRGGAASADWPSVVRAAAQAQADGLAIVTGVWSHFACADEPGHPANDAQEAAFREALAVVDETGLAPEVRHLANSAAALLRPSARFDLVRCGIASYGLSPAPAVGDPAHFGLTPAMTARARLAVVKRIPAGAGVSYGHEFVAAHDTTVALVPVGYGDGIPVHASGRGPVSAAGARRTIAGRVCMDQFVIDLGDDTAQPGDEAVLFGPGTHGEPTAQDWADAADTINYEIVTRIGGRFERRYEGER
ncbi:MAG: alanine racemase [Nocardioidaceae bacterium]